MTWARIELLAVAVVLVVRTENPAAAWLYAVKLTVALLAPMAVKVTVYALDAKLVGQVNVVLAVAPTQAAGAVTLTRADLTPPRWCNSSRNRQSVAGPGRGESSP
jgi:hypothetical protein